MSVVHVTAPGGFGALCGAIDGELILWVEATRPGGEHFTCVACHKALTGGRKHVEPPDGDG